MQEIAKKRQNSLVDEKHADPNIPTHYVGMGASAGGLEAIQVFFKNLPRYTGMAYIIIQHLSPNYKSMMDSLIAKVTELPVHIAEEGMVVETDHIYLIPPKENLKIFHGKLLLNKQDRSQAIVNLPIDIFLTSLAEDQENRAIAVILSGTGSDGTRGSRVVKEVGGMVMVQDVASAKFDGMPQSVINNIMPDFVLPVEEMPKQLIAYSKHPYMAREKKERLLVADEGGVARIFSLLRETSKIDFTLYKPATVERRIERRMVVNQIEKLEEYVGFLENNPKEQHTLYHEFLIGVTCFFRDLAVFKILREKWLLELLKKTQGNEFRIWVAGVSTGEEAYTIAILCREILEQLGKSIDIKIFATDIDQDALTRSGIGSFPESVSADIPRDYLSKFFVKKNGGFQIVRSIREMVVFAKHNLIKDPPFTNIDLVSCRNLLIYFQPPLQQKVFDSFNFSLKKNGLLVLGTSESVGEAEPYFESLAPHRLKIYRSKGVRKPLMESERFTAVTPYHRTGSVQNANGYDRGGSKGEENILSRFIEVLADDIIHFAMIVNESMEILHVVGNASGYLNPPSGKVVNDVTKNVLSVLKIPIASGLSKIFDGQGELIFSNIAIKRNNEIELVNVRIKVLPEQKNKEMLAAIFIIKIDSPKRKSKVGKVVNFDISKEAEERIGDLERELQFSRENLQATIEELETSNEELQATNEELLASNEELQSTNEELQSVNEELFTVNTEYQSKIVELTELNNDLDNYMTAGRIISLFLQEDLDIRRFTSNASKVFNVLNTDIGRPFKHLSHRLLNVDLLPMVYSVNGGGEPIEMEVQTEDRDWFLLKILPYLISAEVQSGVVISLNSINRLKSIEKSYLLLESMTEGYFGLDLNGCCTVCNSAGAEMLGYEPAQLIGKEIHTLIHQVRSDGSKSLHEESSLFQVIQGNGAADNKEDFFRRSNGTSFPVRYRVSPLRHENEIIGSAVAFSDISELRGLQEQINRPPVVLLVEDDEFQQKLFEEEVGSWKLKSKLIIASNGFDGLVMAGRHTPSLIISDLKMPGMDGLQMIEVLQQDERLNQAKFIVVTALENQGMDPVKELPEEIIVMEKPLDFSMLEKIVRQAME